MRRKKGLVGFELTGTLQSWYVESLSRILLVKKKERKFWSARTTNSHRIIIVQTLSSIAVTLDSHNTDCFTNSLLT